MVKFDIISLYKFKKTAAEAAVNFCTNTFSDEFHAKCDGWIEENIDAPLREMIDAGLDKETACIHREELVDIFIEAIEKRPIALLLITEMAAENRKAKEE